MIDCIRNDNPILVAEDKGIIIGFIIVNYNLYFKKAVIENVFVKFEYRNEGIGKRLLLSLLEILMEIVCEYVCALVEYDNDISLDFYMKNSFNRGINCVWLYKILSDRFDKNKDN